MTKYVAKWNGQIVGKRTTANRTYTHALVVQEIEEVARKAAYEFRAPTAEDRSNFEYLVEMVNGTRDTQQPWHGETEAAHAVRLAAEKAKYAPFIVGGFDGYFAREHEKAIARFETEKANGVFNPHVVTWCGRRDLAETQAAAWRARSRTHKVLGIVEAEKVG